MKITDLSVDRSTTIFVALVLIVLAGIYTYEVLPREKFPEIVIPIILISTPYEGVSPTDMETLVTIPLERKLASLSNVKQMSTWSSEGMSTIQIEFEPEVDVESALQKVRDKVDQAEPDLPPDAEEAQIQELNFSEFPIMFLSLTGNQGLPILTEFAETLEEEIESLSGVLEVRVVGGVEREIQIIVDPSRASQYGISMADLLQIAQVENVNTPAGSLKLGEASYLVRVPGEFRSAAEIEDLVVQRSPGGGIVYMRDIATIIDGFKDTASISRLDGVEAVTLSVIKRSGVNIIDLSDDVQAMAAEWKDHLLPGMELKVTMDQSEDIRDMVAELENSILSGLILVLIVIFFFLGFVNAVCVALAIPLSIMIAFIGFYLFDTTVNMVVLFSLILALGMLVDNGVVIVENTYRYLEMGFRPTPAAKKGAGEVAWPLIASTATTLAGYVPMFFWPGIWGGFMFYLPLTVTLTLCGSQIVGLLVNPALASLVMRDKKMKKRENRVYLFIIRVYSAFLRWALRWRGPVFVFSITLLVVITALFFSSATIEFEPETEPNRAYVDIDMPEGTRLEETEKVVRIVEGRVEKYREHVNYILASIGSRGASLEGLETATQSNVGRVTLEFPKLGEDEVLPSTILKQLQSDFSDLVGVEITADAENEGPPTGPPVNIDISGADFAVLYDLAQQIKAEIADVPDVVNIRDDYDKGKPEVLVEVDRQQAALLGLNTQFVGQVVQTAVNGRKAGEYREGNEEYDVMVKFPELFRQDLSNIESMSIVNIAGTPVPFSAVAHMEHGAGFGTIQRLDRKRTLTVSADVQNRPGPEVLQDVQAELANFDMPSGYTLAYTGENEEQQEAQGFLFRAFVVSLLLIAIILITEFNSILQTVIIMTTVIMSITGVFLGLYICNMPFGVLMTGIGCISLAGVVVNNGIVLIDFINQRHNEGASVEDSIMDACVIRFRPVMITAITAMLGLIPMALGVNYDFRNFEWVWGGESTQYWGPMAIAIIFGLSFATLLTLIFVPVLYSLIASVQKALTFSRSDTDEDTPAPPPSTAVAPNET